MYLIGEINALARVQKFIRYELHRFGVGSHFRINAHHRVSCRHHAATISCKIIQSSYFGKSKSSIKIFSSLRKASPALFL
jgi:hypothetical protein